MQIKKGEIWRISTKDEETIIILNGDVDTDQDKKFSAQNASDEMIYLQTKEVRWRNKIKSIRRKK